MAGARDKAGAIAYILHAPVGEPAGRGVMAYLERFPDVELVVPRAELPPFPKSIAEVNQQYMTGVYEPLVAPLIAATIGEVRPLGYGAICTASFGDIGVDRLSEQAGTPVVGLGWSNFEEALLTHRRFSLVHPYTSEISWYFDDLVARYGLIEACASIESYDVDLSDYISIGVRPDIDQIIGLTMPCVERAVKRGAEVILIGCGGQFWSAFAPLLSEATLGAFGVRVLPPIDTMVGFARKLIEKRRPAG